MLLTGIAFGQTYKGHTVKRLTGLNETQAKNLVCSGASTSSYTTRKFDIRTNIKFPVGTLLFLDKPGDDEYGYYYVTYSKNDDWADEDENFDGSVITKVSVFCNRELSINLDGSRISSDCSNCDRQFDDLGTDRHYINRPTGIAVLDVLIENNGSYVSKSTKIGLYISADETLDPNSDIKIKDFSLGTINPGSVRYASGTIFASEIDVTTNFWLLLKIDDSNLNQESDEGNNIFAIRFKVN
jgi:hypothetical protein